jgi:hypothetical protein
MYAYTDPLTGETTLVDRNGVPVDSPPPFTRTVNGGVTVTDAWGNQIETYEPPTQNVFVWIGDDGLPRVVDENGYEVPSPPRIVRDQTGAHHVVAADGMSVPVPAYEPPTSGVYVYVDADGHPIVVTGDGEPLPSPPAVYFDGNDPTPRIVGTELTLPMYEQPRIEMFVHVSADGTPSVVDANGYPIPSPPVVWKDGLDPTWRIKGSTETLAAYTPPTADVFVHPSPNGTYQVVDASGNLVPSPPHVYRDPIDGSYALAGPGGEQVSVPVYDPPTTGIYIEVSPDGSYQVVDRFGLPVPSPPNVYRDAESGSYFVAGADGPGPEIPTLWPPAGEPPESWPPAGSSDEPEPTEHGEDSSGTDDGADEPTAGERGAVDVGGDEEPAAGQTESAHGEPDVDVVEETSIHRTQAERNGPEDRAEPVEDPVAEEVAPAGTTVLGVEADELIGGPASEEVSATPITLPMPPRPPYGGDAEEAPGVEGLPVTIPGEGDSAALGAAAAEVIEDIPLPIPGEPDSELIGSAQVAAVGAVPSPPDETAAFAEPAAAGGVGDLPIPVPEPAGVAEPVAAGGVGDLPIAIPDPAVEETWEESAVVEEVEAVEPMIEAVEDEQLDG